MGLRSQICSVSHWRTDELLVALAQENLGGGQKSLISKWELELPKSLSAALSAGNKKWTLLFSIREFGTSSTVGGRNIVVLENSRKQRDTALINKAKHVNAGRNESSNKKTLAEGLESTRARTGNNGGNGKPSKPAKQAKPAKAGKPAKASKPEAPRRSSKPARPKKNKNLNSFNVFDSQFGIRPIKGMVGHKFKPGKQNFLPGPQTSKMKIDELTSYFSSKYVSAFDVFGDSSEIPPDRRQLPSYRLD